MQCQPGAKGAKRRLKQDLFPFVLQKQGSAPSHFIMVAGGLHATVAQEWSTHHMPPSRDGASVLLSMEQSYRAGFRRAVEDVIPVRLWICGTYSQRFRNLGLSASLILFAKCRAQPSLAFPPQNPSSLYHSDRSLVDQGINVYIKQRSILFGMHWCRMSFGKYCSAVVEHATV